MYIKRNSLLLLCLGSFKSWVWVLWMHVCVNLVCNIFYRWTLRVSIRRVTFLLLWWWWCSLAMDFKSMGIDFCLHIQLRWRWRWFWFMRDNGIQSVSKHDQFLVYIGSSMSLTIFINPCWLWFKINLTNTPARFVPISWSSFTENRVKALLSLYSRWPDAFNFLFATLLWRIWAISVCTEAPDILNCIACDCILYFKDLSWRKKAEQETINTCNRGSSRREKVGKMMAV